MIYIVEIPHQRQPFCWSAHDEEDAVDRIYRSHINKKYMSDDWKTFSEWVRYNGLELHSQYVFMDAAAAIDGLKEIGKNLAHVAAIAALHDELKANGELPEEIDHDH